MFVDIYNVKLLDCKNIIHYINRYQIIFDIILNLINRNFWVSKRNIKIIQYENLLRFFGKNYSAIVSAIKIS